MGKMPRVCVYLYVTLCHVLLIESGEKGNRHLFKQPPSRLPRRAKARLLQVTVDTAQARCLLFSHLGSSIPTLFLAELLFWLTVLFGGFALLARPNATTLVALTLCALSVSAAIFLLLELDQPFSGVMAIKSEPLREALGPLNS